MILPPTERVERELATDKAAEPIKKMSDINAVCDYLIENQKWRDYMLFVVGINFGLRVSDLRTLRFCDLIDENLQFRDVVPVFEQKTRNTRKRKKNRYLTVNKAVMDAVLMYLDHTPDVTLSDFMFRSQSNHGKNKNAPMDRVSVDRVLKSMAKACGLTMKVSTHTLRKTFCYHQMLMAGNDHRKLLLLQKMLGHSSESQTLDYIGITQEEMVEAYKDLNLGLQRKVFDTDLIESDAKEGVG
jgi:integrase